MIRIRQMQDTRVMAASISQDHADVKIAIALRAAMALTRNLSICHRSCLPNRFIARATARFLELLNASFPLSSSPSRGSSSDSSFARRRIGGGQAGEAHSFIVAANDGYGIQDCLGEGGECGRVVADAWCEAHGHGAALTFGRADDVTGAGRRVADALCHHLRRLIPPHAFSARSRRISAPRRSPPPKARSAPSRSSSSASRRSACPYRSYRSECCA